MLSMAGLSIYYDHDIAGTLEKMGERQICHGTKWQSPYKALQDGQLPG